MTKSTAVRLWRVAQIPACALMFVTGVAEVLSVDWFDALYHSVYGRWILAAAFVLTMAMLGEWVFAWSAGKKPGAAGAVADAEREPVLMDPPVTGRWEAANSPADKVPSHGTHWGGQSHAIDIKRVSQEGSSGGPARQDPAHGIWRLHRPEAFPAYGSPILAPAEGTVVEVVDRRRDHRARTSLLGFLYFLLVEQFVRSLAPHSFTFGNHVVLRIADGVYADFCHLRRGSIAVEAGDTVSAGQLLGQCGNSGNSTEPHLHFQLMDSPGGHAARGIPFSWRGIGVPRAGEQFTAEAPACAASGTGGAGSLRSSGTGGRR